MNKMLIIVMINIVMLVKDQGLFRVVDFEACMCNGFCDFFHFG